jgi:CRP/FNR family transcriptional regulator, cyclic AMP receptor protein
VKPDQTKLAIDTIRQIFLFAGATESQLAAIAAVLTFRALAPGKVVILEQEISKSLYVLAKGTVSIWRRVKGEKKRLAELHAPDCFGEISMFTESSATAQVKTESECQFFVLARADWDALATKDQALADIIRTHVETLKAARPAIQEAVPGPSGA